MDMVVDLVVLMFFAFCVGITIAIVKLAVINVLLAFDIGVKERIVKVTSKDDSVAYVVERFFLVPWFKLYEDHNSDLKFAQAQIKRYNSKRIVKKEIVDAS